MVGGCAGYVTQKPTPPQHIPGQTWWRQAWTADNLRYVKLASFARSS